MKNIGRLLIHRENLSNHNGVFLRKIPTLLLRRKIWDAYNRWDGLASN